MMRAELPEVLRNVDVGVVSWRSKSLCTSVGNRGSSVAADCLVRRPMSLLALFGAVLGEPAARTDAEASSKSRFDFSAVITLSVSALRLMLSRDNGTEVCGMSIRHGVYN